MTAYAVLSRAGVSGADPDALLVGDRFVWLGFVFSLPWLLFHRLWIAFLALLAAGLITGAVIGERPEWALFGLALSFVLSLIVGFEGQNWRIASLCRRGYRLADIVEAPDAEAAHAIYANRFAGSGTRAATPPVRDGPVQNGDVRSAARPDLIGLVPMGGDGRT